MNEHDCDELLLSAIESGTLDSNMAPDTEIVGRFATHQKLESLFAVLCEPSSLDDPLDQPSQIGRYRVEGVLGEGAFGKVYLAHYPELDRSVAIKIPRANVFSSEQDADSFLKEAKLAASLDHPGVVTIHGCRPSLFMRRPLAMLVVLWHLGERDFQAGFRGAWLIVRRG